MPANEPTSPIGKFHKSNIFSLSILAPINPPIIDPMNTHIYNIDFTHSIVA